MEFPDGLPEHLKDTFQRLYNGEPVTDLEFMALVSWASDAVDRVAGALEWDEYGPFYIRLNTIEG